jgi:hypothetical protein
MPAGIGSPFRRAAREAEVAGLRAEARRATDVGISGPEEGLVLPIGAEGATGADDRSAAPSVEDRPDSTTRTVVDGESGAKSELARAYDSALGPLTSTEWIAGNW